MALVTTDDVLARLGRPATDATEEARISAFIEDATGLVCDFCWTDFQRHTGESFEAQVEEGKAPLASALFPGLVISSVTLIGVGALGEADWYVRGRVLHVPCAADGSTLTVTGSWGWSAVPATVRAAVCSEVIRWISVSPGTVMEKTGDLQVEYAATAYSQGLSEAAKSMLSKYRPPLGSITLIRS
ncbi:hypothetical protein ACIQUL_36255 [Streptomyces sp. NPDC090303]|uniref:hypothetical protein n=1 Tax=Streptomyces sp. NPDC090303 TaxID=3365960 RepID=UPI003819439A